MSDESPKSALEVAMARLKQKDADEGVTETPLTEDQKKDIAEIRQAFAAKLAQEEILFKSKLQGVFEFEARQQLEEHYRRDVDRLNHERDRKIAKVRSAE